MANNLVDLNADIGEGFGRYSLGNDGGILNYVTSANIACGFHAGDPVIMKDTALLAQKNRVSIGAHVSYPDLQGFGRREMSMSSEEIKCSVMYQIGALKAFGKICHVKPHGAMYNMASRDMNIAMAICEGVYEADKELILLGLSGSKLIEAAKLIGLRHTSEVFADRAYNADGSLVKRGIDGAILTDISIIAPRVIKMIKSGTVTAITGEEIPVAADSICLHGDNPKAIEFAKALRAAIELEGVSVCPLSAIA